MLSGDFILAYNTTLLNLATMNTGQIMFASSVGGFLLYNPLDDNVLPGTQYMTTESASLPSDIATSLNGDRVFAATNALKFFDFSEITRVTTSTVVSTKTLATNKNGDRLLLNPLYASAVGMIKGVGDN